MEKKCSAQHCLHISPFISTLEYKYPQDKERFNNLFGKEFGTRSIIFNICNPCFLYAVSPKQPHFTYIDEIIYIYNGTHHYRYDYNKLMELAKEYAESIGVDYVYGRCYILN